MTHHPLHPRTIFITGISRGLGLATAKLAGMRGFNVVGTVRKHADLEIAQQINEDIRGEGGQGQVRAEILDVVAAPPPRQTLLALFQADILINNSGVGADIFYPDITLSSTDMNLLSQAVAINALGPLRLMSLALPAMRARGWGRVVNVSSVLARMADPIGETAAPAYRMSKTLLNSITVQAAMEYKGTGVLINSVCPGWCKTEMGREEAPETPEQGAERIMYVAQLPDDGPTGAFFINNKISHF